jgi:hypothetical protein
VIISNKLLVFHRRMKPENNFVVQPFLHLGLI